MATYPLQTNIAASYPDASAADKLHKELHDLFHGTLNSLVAAYDAAVAAGFVGTVQDWLDTIASMDTRLDTIEGDNATQTELDAVAAAKVSTTGNETIAGVKTFSSSPIVPTPTTDFQAATKGYADSVGGGGGGGGGAVAGAYLKYTTGGSTTSATFANVPEFSTVAITKTGTGPLVCQFDMTVYCTTAGGSIEIAVKVGAGADNVGKYFFFNTINKHESISGAVVITGLAASAHTLQLRWRNPAATGTVTADTSDSVSLVAIEGA